MRAHRGQTGPAGVAGPTGPAGSTPVSATVATNQLSGARDRIWHLSGTYLVTGLNNVATTFTAQYRTDVNNNECDFSDRSIIVTPY